MQTVCTIITSDYLSYANALRSSLLLHEPRAPLRILIVDISRKQFFKSYAKQPNVQYDFLEDMPKDGIAKAVINKYSNDLDKLRWSLKPLYIQYLLASYEKVLYCDSDIYFFNDYQFLFSKLENAGLLLTPHWRSASANADYEHFKLLFVGGLYNAGFIGASRSGMSALDNWAANCLALCEKDFSQGLCDDQTHLNLLPLYFESVQILKHRGCNIASWNRVECKRVKSQGSSEVLINNTDKIIFIHFTEQTIRTIKSGNDPLLQPHLEAFESHLARQTSEASPKSALTPFFVQNLTMKNMDTFFIRRTILCAIEKFSDLSTGSLLDVGCGQMPYRDYLLDNSSISKYTGLDIESPLVYNVEVEPDVRWDGKNMPFDNASFETILATEVLEHCPHPQQTLSEIYRVLKDDGFFCFTVPFLWPLHEAPHDEFRYTPYALKRLLTEAGFKKDSITILPGGGWHASLAQMLGLWLKRSPISPNIKRILSFLGFPIIKLLIRLDARRSYAIKDQQMFTSFYGFAKK